MNKVRALTVTAAVGLVFFMTAGVANASPGTGPATPEWLPAWAWPAYYFVWGIGYALQNGLNPFTGLPW